MHRNKENNAFNNRGIKWKPKTNINHTVETIPKSNVNIIEGKTDTNTWPPILSDLVQANSGCYTSLMFPNPRHWKRQNDNPTLNLIKSGPIVDRCEHTIWCCILSIELFWNITHSFWPWIYATQFDTGVELISTGKKLQF